MRNKNISSFQEGFTLVEMMVVVVIVGVLATVSFPQLIRTKMTSNEAVVQKDLTNIAAALEIYRSSQNPPIYPASLSDLGDLGDGSIPFLDPAVAAGSQHGYHFKLTVNATGDAYGCVANPIQVGSTGNRGFCMNHEGILMQYDAQKKIKSDGSGCPSNELLLKAEPVEGMTMTG